MGEFRMPSLGADMDEGTLLEWLVGPGDPVHRGDIVAVVDTDKAAIEVEVFEDGVVEGLLVQPGTRVAVGTPLATIAAPGTAPATTSAPATVPTPAPVAMPAPLPTPAPGLVRASPLARRRAAQLGVDLHTVTGSGPGGAVLVADVTQLAPGGHPTGDDQGLGATGAGVPAQQPRGEAMQRAVGALMARSKREVPHYYLSTTVDLAAATDWLRAENARRDVEHRLVPAAMLLKAAALAARTVPEVNGTWVDEHFEPAPSVHLGVAVSLRSGGLVAPAILDADTLDLDTLMQRLRDLVTRARSGRLRQTEMTAGTLTVTNLGDQGVETVFGVIYPPQVALVGFGRVLDRPFARDGMVGVRPVVTATLSADHRVSDGHRGGRYLNAVADLLQKPETL